MRFFFPLSGDDVFISYSRKDGALYAVGLADKLTGKELSCFIDKLGTEPNHDLPPSLKKKIKNCTVFVLVGSEKAAQSEFVKKEIAEFRKTGRTILPIDFDGNVGKAIWYDEIPGLAAESEKDPKALETGDPSQNVINFIEKSFNYTRRNQFMSRMFWGALSVFLVLVGLGAGASYYAVDRINFANEKIEEARQAELIADEENKKARKAEENANKQERIAKDAEAEATKQSNIAKDERTKAESAGKLANEKNKLALEKTKLADEKTELADVETKRANREKLNADVQAKKAEEKRKEAEEQSEKSRQLNYAADMKTASNLYEAGNETGDFSRFFRVINETKDDLKGIEWSYLNHLTEGITYFNLKQPDKPQTIENLAFSPKGTYLTAADSGLSDTSTGSQNETISSNRFLVWNTETGERTGFISEKDKLSDYSFAPNEKFFAACSEKKLKIWDTTTIPWTKSQIKNFEKNEECENVAFKDNDLILIVSKIDSQKILKKINIQTGKLVEEKSITKRFPDKNVDVVKIFSTGNILIKYKLSDANAAQKNYQYSVTDDNLEKEFDLGSISNESKLYFSPTNDQIAFYNSETEPIQLIDFHLNTLSKYELKDLVSESGWKDVALSPNGKYIAALDGIELRIWNTETKKLEPKLNRPYNSYGTSIAFTPDSSGIAIGGTSEEMENMTNENRNIDTVLLIWDINRKGDVFTFNDESLISLSADGTKALTSDAKISSLNLWNTLDHKEPILRIESDSQKYSLGNIIFSPDNLYFVIPKIANNDKTISLELRDTKNNIFELLPDKNCKVIGKPAFSSDSKKIFDICENGTLIIWNVADGKEIRKNGKEPKPFIETDENTRNKIKEKLETGYNDIQIFKAKNRLIVEVSENELLVWDINSGKQLTYCSEQIIKISPDGERLITQDNTESIKYFLRDAGDVSCAIKPLILGEMTKNDEMNLGGFAFSNDSKYLATYYNFNLSGDYDSNEYFIVDTETKKVVNQSRARLNRGDDENVNVKEIEFSSKGNWVRFDDMFWDKNLKRHFTIEDCADNPIFLPDDSRFITSCGTGELKFWSPLSGQEVLRLNTKDNNINEIIFMDQGKYLLTSGSKLRLWRMRF